MSKSRRLKPPAAHRSRHIRFPSQRVRSVTEFLRAINRSTASWQTEGNFRPWFRGQADAGDPPLPSVLRREFDQVRMTLTFRNRAPAFGHTPPQDQLAEWLFLMQHYGLPTRLLDWTENPLIACLFAIEETLRRGLNRRAYLSRDLAVWVLHPIELNRLSGIDDFELATRTQCRTLENFKFAFGTAGELGPPLEPTNLPLAVQARYLDTRMAGQQSCFTVHGRDRRDFEALLIGTDLTKRGLFRKFVLLRRLVPDLLEELDRLGVSFATLYPDFEGLSRQLKARFTGRPTKPIIPPVSRTLPKRRRRRA
jgi:hypothetical protein